jgi:hypothetical protein
MFVFVFGWALSAPAVNAQEQKSESDAIAIRSDSGDGPTSSSPDAVVAKRSTADVTTDVLTYSDKVEVDATIAAARPVKIPPALNLKPASSPTLSPAGQDSSAAGPTPQPAAPEWEFYITPYFFTAGLGGDVGARGRSAHIDASFSDIWDRLEFGLMGTFEARKGNWGLLVDAMYIKLGNEAPTPGRLFSSVETESKMLIFNPEVNYRAFRGKAGAIDLTAGVRIWHLRNSLTFLPGLLAQVDVSQSKNWADPVVGGRGIMYLAPKLFLTGKFDVGGFGVGSDFTGQAFGGVGIQVKPRVALIGGYRYLYVDYFSDGFLFKTELNGLIFGARFKF